MDDDKPLVLATLGGDKEAFAKLYGRHARLVRAICFEYTGSVVDAQDLAQETFLRAFRQLNKLKTPSRFGAWVNGIARLVSLQWQRERFRHREKCIQQADGDVADQTEALCDCELHEEMMHALGTLSEKERTAIHLFYLEDVSAERARDVLSVSLSGFYRILERARKKLAKHLMYVKES